MPYVLSAFADELGPDIGLQIEVLSRLGIEEIQLRGAWGRNVMDLSDQELREFRRRAGGAGLGFHAIGSPLGKSPISASEVATLQGVQRAAEIGHIVGTNRVRVFSFYPDGEPGGVDFRSRVVERIQKMCAVAEAAGATLFHENEKGIYGDTAARCLDLLESVPGLGCCFDFANFVQVGEQPGRDCWPLLGDRVGYFDIKDARSTTGEVVPAGEGQGDVAEVLRQALAGKRTYRLNLEPHLSAAGHSGGETTPKLFELAVTSLRALIPEPR